MNEFINEVTELYLRKIDKEIRIRRFFVFLVCDINTALDDGGLAQEFKRAQRESLLLLADSQSLAMINKLTFIYIFYEMFLSFSSVRACLSFLK